VPDTGPECFQAHRLFDDDPPETLILAAHPDDEVIGAAGALMRLRTRASVVHVTDGAPRNLEDAVRAGFSTAEGYARARRRESQEALSLVEGVKLLDNLEIPDQSACRRLPELVLRLIDLLKATRPAVVLTHAFEGGHPDHDAVAFAASYATRTCGVPLLEMSGYFDDGHGLATGRFARSDGPAFIHHLTPGEATLKQRMLACFRTQAETLAQFGTRVECYRPAPAYDFARPPNDGRAFYDRFNWGLRSAEWPELVTEALQQLGVAASIP